MAQVKSSVGFRFGIEAEYLLVDAVTFRPLWHTDLEFSLLNRILEEIPLDHLPSLTGLELEPPHKKLMPFVVEGYHIPNENFEMVDIKPKGIEIRTPVTESIGECLSVFADLQSRLQKALLKNGYRAVALSHHPVESNFLGPQNKRRYDYWQWAMEVMTTYGPDINVSLPPEMSAKLDTLDLVAKINYYGPALTALTVSSPFLNGDLWQIRGATGKSFRTYRRSVIAPPIEIHPDEGYRLEFKVFEMSPRNEDYRNYFLLFLSLLLDQGLKGRASAHTRIYDLGQVARYGLEAPEVFERADELLSRAPIILSDWGFDPTSLTSMNDRLLSRRTPADDLIDSFRQNRDLPAIMKQLSQFE
jgi:carboxylate-amine ligase